MPLLLPRPLPGGPLRRPEGRLLLHRITTQARWGLAIGVTFLLGIPAVTADGGRPPNVVLILADDEDLRRALAGRFANGGMAVTALASAEEALARAAHTRFDVA